MLKPILNNAQIADNRVGHLRKLLVVAGQNKSVAVSVNTLLILLESMERLAAIERHLYNLTSMTYRKTEQQEETVNNV